METETIKHAINATGRSSLAQLTDLSNLLYRPIYPSIWTKMVLIMIIIRNRSVYLGLPGVTWVCAGGFQIANGTWKAEIG